MDCLKDYIGLKQCTATEPESGYFVNDLPGISTELAHRIADSDQLNFAGVWASVQTRAERRFMQLVQRFINREKNWREILYQTPGYKIETPLSYKEYVSANAEIFLPEGKYVEAVVKSLLFYSGTASNSAQISILDAFGNTLHFMDAVEIKQGINRKAINFTIGAEDAGGKFVVSLLQPDGLLSLNQINLNDAASLSDCVGCESAIQESGLIIPEVTIKCAVSRYICENKSQFTYALWYLHGAELLAEKLTSPRTTYFASSNLEYTKQLQADFYTEFEESTIQSLKAIDLQSLCVSCKEDMPGQISFGSLIV